MNEVRFGSVAALQEEIKRLQEEISQLKRKSDHVMTIEKVHDCSFELSINFVTGFGDSKYLYFQVQLLESTNRSSKLKFSKIEDILKSDDLCCLMLTKGFLYIIENAVP